MDLLRIEGVHKRFGANHVVKGVDLHVAEGEFVSLLGPSGCGKTTLLRMIAGFEHPDEGRILLDGQDIGPLPPHKRPVNTVFQHYALFPHLTVGENVAFGLRRQGRPEDEIRTRVKESLDQVRLGDFVDRMPAQMSGGQKQRVALARSLVLRPRVLLLDEPLGALDHQLRLEMQVELRRIQRACGITFVFVTHDQPEALTMSDRIVVMSKGIAEQVGTAHEVYERPATEFVARFLGASNLLVAKVEGFDGDRASVRIDGGPACSVLAGFRPDLGADVRVMLRPEWLLLADAEPRHDGWRGHPVEVTERIYQGAVTRWAVRGLGVEELEVTATPAAGFGSDGPDLADLRPGQKGWLCWRDGNGVMLRASA
ncbi:MAG: ABC transporter ATP-binding protein [Myxococcota bacterium]